VVLPNPQDLAPGPVRHVEVMSQETEVPVAVAADAIQTMEGKSVVFVRVADGFVAQPTTGRSDGKLVEIPPACRPATKSPHRQLRAQGRTGQGRGRAQPLSGDGDDHV
jgi:hypothetical protein